MHSATTLLNKSTPHGPWGGVIGEGEVDSSVEELLKVLFRPVVRLTGTPDNSYPRLIRDPLVLPLGDRLLNSRRVLISLLPLLLLSLLLLGWPNLLTLVNIDYCRLVRFSALHHHGNHFVAVSPMLVIQVRCLHRRQVETHSFCLSSNRPHHHSLPRTIRPVKHYGADMRWVSFSDKFRA